MPLVVAIAYFAPVYLAIFFSNLSTNLPTEDTNVVSIHWFKYFFSLPINFGSCNGMNSLVPYIFLTKSIKSIKSIQFLET